MPKRSRTPDLNENAFRVMKLATELHDPDATKPAANPKRHRKNPAAVALGRKGGKVGGKRRAENMTAAERSEASSKAAQARWGRRKG